MLEFQGPMTDTWRKASLPFMMKLEPSCLPRKRLSDFGRWVAASHILLAMQALERERSELNSHWPGPSQVALGTEGPIEIHRVATVTLRSALQADQSTKQEAR